MKICDILFAIGCGILMVSLEIFICYEMFVEMGSACGALAVGGSIGLNFLAVGLATME